MTRQQAQWASEHDWCLKVVCTNVLNNEWLAHVRDDELPQGHRVLTDFKELRAWAGY